MNWNWILRAKKSVWGKGGDGSQIKSSAPKLESKLNISGSTFSTFSGNTEIRNRKIVGVDFTGAKLRSLRLFDVTFIECSFDNADLRDLRMWSTELRQCSFRRADLRGSGLGGIFEGRRNCFADVDFKQTDMRQTGWTSASFDHCIFKDVNLKGVNLQGSTFRHCVFEGELRDVIFNRYAYKREDLPENEMENIDFSKANLQFVEFRNLKLDRVSFPKDDEHIILEDYRRDLERAFGNLREDDDPVAKKLRSFLSHELKWTVVDRTQGLINKNDLIAFAGDTAPRRLLAALS